MATKMIPVMECKRCGHEWVKRMDAPSRICPKCKSLYWNQERRQVGEGARTGAVGSETLQ
jgi:predicted Zn-ribbon and HTH transcriptional regulator